MQTVRVTAGDPRPQDLEQVADVERELRRLLRRLRRYSAEMARTVHPDLEPAVYGLLVDISDAEATRAVDLAQDRGVTKGVISRQVRQLETMELIVRRPDPVDARAQVLVATARGRAAVQEAQGRRRERIDRLLTGSTSAERAAYVEVLTRFNDLME